MLQILVCDTHFECLFTLFRDVVDRSPLRPINGGSHKDEDEAPKKKMRRLLDSDDEEETTTVQEKTVGMKALESFVLGL